ncbi:MAG: hypothetical protein HYU66_16645 [Armatimonadetes bacterium]|nr:hypothetical protein [Armatimonadota bacterium]
MRLPPLPELLGRDPFETARGRLLRTLSVDAAVLRGLRRGAREDDSLRVATYAWALGVAPEGLAQSEVSADQYALAAGLSPDDPHIQFGCGLAHAGGFGRRAMPLAARRGFAAAAKLDPGNLVGHLALTAARFSTGDLASGLRCVDGAAGADRFRPFRSPLGDQILDAAPWLGYSLALLWPQRTGTAVRYALTSLVAAATARRRRDEAPEILARLDSLAGRMLRGCEARADDFLQACGGLQVALAAREATASGAAEQRHAVSEVVREFLEARRKLAKVFEGEARKVLGGAGGTVAAGLVAVLVGLAKSRRRWPPPIPLAVPGRLIAWAGVGLAALGAAAVATPNPVALARRKRVEERLLAAEAELVEAARAKLVVLWEPATT